MSWKLQNLARGAGWAKLALLILAGLTLANAGRAQTTFATAQVLPITDNYGSVICDNTNVHPDVNCPNIAGFAPHAPLWFKWTAPSGGDGEVELDTIGSVNDTNQTPLNTVLAVATGANLTTLNLVAANDNLFPINNSIPQINESDSGDYCQFPFGGPGGLPIIGYYPLYYGPSHLRFNAQAGVTYYIVVDSQPAINFLGTINLGSGPGKIVLHWAYKSSGVFRFASEDVDYSTGVPKNTPVKTFTDPVAAITTTNYGKGHLTGILLYQCAQTESSYAVKYVPEGNSVLYTYYNYDPPGVLVNVTRVAGSAGRATVKYQTVNVANLTNFFANPNLTNYWPLGVTNYLPVGDVAARPGTDYQPVSGTLVFDDYEMSKTILIPIFNSGNNSAGSYTNNMVFGVQLIDNGSNSPALDQYESGDVAPPRVDPHFSLALVKILNVNADPYGQDMFTVVSTNLLNPWLDPPTNTIPNLLTNFLIGMPTNPIVNFQKCNIRVPEDVTDPAIGHYGYTTVTLYARRSPNATNTSDITLHYRINNFLNGRYDSSEEWNNWFPLQPGSDYAVPTPATWSGQLMGTNSDFDAVKGDITFPANGVDANLMPITFTVTNSTLTKFNRDFKIEMYQEKTVNGQTVPVQAGMVGETTVTILFNDQHPPAGSVDELYNADFGHFMALAPAIVRTLPQYNDMPGVSGLVNSLLVLSNNETLIAGDFFSYNGQSINSIALVTTNGALDTSFSPGSGPDDGPINSVALTPDNKFVVGGNFTSFNGVLSHNYVVRLNANGSFDPGFNAAADDYVRAVAVQPDGKVLIGGDFQNVNGLARNYLARLNANGSLDTTFDPSNTLTGPVYSIVLPFSSLAINNAANGNSNEVDQPIYLGLANSGTLTVNYAMQGQPDDMRVFYGGTNGVLIYDTGWVSYNNGSPFVLPFGPTNGLTTNLITIVMDQGGGQWGTLWDYSATVSFNGGGQITVGGDFGVTGQSYARIARFNTNGLLDTTFSPLSGANDVVYALGLQSDGRVVAGGAFTTFNGIALNCLARLNTDGSLDSTNFFPGSGANDVVRSITLQPDGSMYVGGQFSSFNGTHRLGFTRLYADGTVDTTFLDTAYNQFAGLKRIYSDDTPAVFASGVQSDGNVMIGGTFYQVGGGQASASVCNYLDDQLSEQYGVTVQESFNDPNLWVEPKTRDGVRNRSSIARLIGGSTPGPGTISLSPPFSVNRSSPSLSVGLVRTNGMLGPVSANFSVQPGTAKSGVDYSYNSPPPLFWVAWRFTTSTISRLRSDGLFGGNGSLQDVFDFLSQADSSINKLAAITLTLFKDPQMLGNLNAQFQLANPSGAGDFYLGGQNIPLGAALGPSAAPFTLVDDSKNSGSFGFASTNYVATNIITSISVVRSNGVYGQLSMHAFATNGTAIVGTDYKGLTNKLVTIPGNQVSTTFTVTNMPNGLQSTAFAEKTVNLHLNPPLTAPVDGNATIGISNAVLRLINPNFQGYLTFSATDYTGSESAGFISLVVNRVTGSAGALTVQYATTDGPSATNKADYYGATNLLSWISGDASSRTVSIALTNNGTVAPNKQFHVLLSNPTLNGTNQPALFYVGSPGSITNATLTISNDNSYGAFQFSAPSYVVNENGGYATITVLRTGGIAAPVSVRFVTSDGPYATNGVNYIGTNNVLTFAPNQTAASFNVQIIDDGKTNNPNFYFNVRLTNAVNAVMGSQSNAVVNILDSLIYVKLPGTQDGSFTPVLNGDVLALALQPNGQILAGGAFTLVNGVPENCIARLNANGSLDSAGFLNGQAGASGAVQAVVCQTDGRVMIGGAFTNVNNTALNHIARLMTDGSLDTSFNPAGGASGPVYSLVETFINGAREIYVGGAFSIISGGYNPYLARLNNGGSLDAFFATGSGPDGAVYAIAVYPSNSPFAGKLLVGGAFTNINGFTLGHVARMNADGSVDTNFDLNLGANDTVRAIAIQSDGGILVGGDFTNFNGTALNHIARLNSDGSLDANFTANVAGGANGTVQAIAVQADNRIVLAGQFTQANGVTRSRITRLLPTGAVDPMINFGDGANGAIDALVIQPADQMLVIGGGFTQYDDQPAPHLARIYGGSVTGPGGFQFTSASYQVDERGGQALITISRTGGTSGTSAVQFSTVNGGSAVPGTNYMAVTNVISFPPGEVFETATVPVMDDGVVTTTPLTVNLVITNIPPAVISGQNTATLTIINDESAVSFLNANDSVDKNVPGGFKAIDVIRLGGTNGTCSVDLLTTTKGTAVAGVDYWPTNTTVNFNPGDTDIQVQVPIINNSLPEGNRTVIFVLTNVVNTLLYSPSNETLTIIDTVNAPGQLCFSATNYVFNEGGTAYITVLRTNGTTGHVTATVNTIAGTAVPGVNYIAPASTTVNFNDGDTSATFMVPLVDNSLVQGPVSFTNVLSNPTGGASLIAPTTNTVTIMDNDTGFAFAAATNTVSESASYAAVNVLRIGDTSASNSVYYTTVNGTAIAGVNYQSMSGTLGFAIGESLRSIHVPLIYDPRVTGDLKFTIVLSSPGFGVIAAPGTNTVVVQDADAGLHFANSTSSVMKSAGSAIITVVCSNPDVEPVSVQYTTTNGTATAGVDYVAVTGTLVFTNGIGTQTFPVPIINNTLVTGNRTFTVKLSNPTPPGQLTSPSNQVVTIIDSNSGLSFSKPAYTVLKNGLAANINVLRTGYTDSVVSVNYLATNGTAFTGINFVATNGILVFTNGVTNLSFSVPIIDTTAVQPDLTVLLELFSPVNGFLVPPSAAILTIHDTSGSYVVPAGSALIHESGPTNGIIDPNETVTLLFAFRDAGGVDVTNLQATLLAGNGVTSPHWNKTNSPIGVNYGYLTSDGHSVSQPFTFTAQGTNGQQITATFLLTNTSPVITNLNTAVFGYTLGSWTTIVSNPATIFINDNTNASPYPSTVKISGLGGALIKATITLTNLWHTSPEDIDALLVPPSQISTLFMAHVGGQYAIQNITITFDDASTNYLPHLTPITTIPNAVMTNHPTVFLPVQNFP